MPSKSTAVTSADTGPGTRDVISFRTSENLRPVFATSEGLVVTPSQRPIASAFLISPTSAESMKNCIARLPVPSVAFRIAALSDTTQRRDRGVRRRARPSFAWVPHRCPRHHSPLEHAGGSMTNRTRGVGSGLALAAALATGALAGLTRAQTDGGVPDAGALDGGVQGTMLDFHTMTPVSAPFVGSSNPIRGVNGGAQPWVIGHGDGTLRADGEVEVSVSGLVLANDPAVPQAQRGTNPNPTFAVIEIGRAHV